MVGVTDSSGPSLTLNVCGTMTILRIDLSTELHDGYYVECRNVSVRAINKHFI